MNEPLSLWILRGVMGLTLVVGSLIAYYALSSGRRLRNRPLIYLGVGFALVSLAAVLAGVIFEVLTHDYLDAWLVSATFNAAGFLVILFSLFTTETLSMAGSARGPEALETPSPSGEPPTAPPST